MDLLFLFICLIRLVLELIFSEWCRAGSFIRNLGGIEEILEIVFCSIRFSRIVGIVLFFNMRKGLVFIFLLLFVVLIFLFGIFCGFLIFFDGLEFSLLFRVSRWWLRDLRILFFLVNFDIILRGDGLLKFLFYNKLFLNEFLRDGLFFEYLFCCEFLDDVLELFFFFIL